MNRNEIITILASSTSTLTALRAALKAAGAYSGHSKDSVADMRAHADATAKAMVDTDLAEDANAHTVVLPVAKQVTVLDEIIAEQVAAKPAKVAKVKKPQGPTCPMTGRLLSARQQTTQDKLASLVGDGPQVEVAMADYVATFGEAFTRNARAFTPGGWKLGRDGERPSDYNGVLAAAIRLGLAVTWQGDKYNTGTLQVERLDGQAAATQRDQYLAGVAAYKAGEADRRAARLVVSAAGRQAGRGAPSGATVAKLMKAIAQAPARHDGTVVLDGHGLALGGLGQNWASIPNAHLLDAEHVKARTVAACGYTGRTTRRTLVLTPIAAQEVEAAS